MGKNFESGGRFFSDSMIIRISMVIRGVLFFMYKSDSVVVEELYMNSINAVSVNLN